MTRDPVAMLAFLREWCRPADAGCLEWAGMTGGGGYPMVVWDKRKYLARRLLIELAQDKRLRGRYVYASCGNRLCMNEAHLLVGSKSKAMANSAELGRFQSGAQRRARMLASASDPKVSHRDRETILEMRANGATQQEIADRFGVTRQRISQALKTLARL